MTNVVYVWGSKCDRQISDSLLTGCDVSWKKIPPVIITPSNSTGQTQGNNVSLWRSHSWYICSLVQLRPLTCELKKKNKKKNTAKNSCIVSHWPLCNCFHIRTPPPFFLLHESRSPLTSECILPMCYQWACFTFTLPYYCGSLHLSWKQTSC